MFDTHCHLNFARFTPPKGDGVDAVIRRAHEAGVSHILIPGTNRQTSETACSIAVEHENTYAAVGIHPHHVFEQYREGRSLFADELHAIGELLKDEKVLAVGEVGLDKHQYEGTKYPSYAVTPEFVLLQKDVLAEQIKLALVYGKSLILHNREAMDELIPLLETVWDRALSGRTVFHCCEPDRRLLDFAIAHDIFIGVDGDVTYMPEKQAFVREIPRELLVVETDSPYLLPEPLRAKKKYPNEPKNIPLVADFIAEVRGEPTQEVRRYTMENAMRLFGLHQKMSERMMPRAKPIS